ncbi:MAG TPA: amidohydrolase family protein, partial [Thermoanaerobaculia bacterium]|nr:amidohydrolase family protein [Thermoanaerobaculia bacterium]
MFALLTLALSATLASAPPPDLLLEDATVYVAADAPPARVSILLSGRIAFVGDPAEARKRGSAARRVPLAGRVVFPGWADAHLHLLGLGKSLEVAALRGSKSAAEAAGRMQRAAAGLPPGAWIEGRGWDQNLWPGAAFPDARDLDAVLPGRPALARRVDGHALWVNGAVLAAAHIGAATPDPPGGR